MSEVSQEAREAAARYFAAKYGGGFGAHLACLDDGNTLVQAFAQFQRQIEAATVERCAKVAEGEKVDAEATGDPSDIAYNIACDHCATAIRAEVKP